MLRDAARRLLWTPPILIGVSIASFWVLSLFGLGPEQRETLPRLLNFAPADVAVHAPTLVERVALAGDAEAASELVRLGGAALPHILPTWDGFAPEARARVALALVPLAVRMGVLSERSLDGPAAISFWNRFWQDHSVEFQPIASERLLRRVARRPESARTKDVLRLDTYALRELILKMGVARTSEDVARIRHLSELASGISGYPVPLPDPPSAEDANHAARIWRRWWVQHRTDYMTLVGPTRLAAVITETQYGRWVASLLAPGFGDSKSGAPVLSVIREPVTLTATLFAIAWPLAWVLSAVAGRLRRSRRSAVHFGKDAAGAGSRRERASAFAFGLLAGLPGGLGYFLFFSTRGPSPWLAGALAATSVAAVGLEPLRRSERWSASSAWRKRRMNAPARDEGTKSRHLLLGAMRGGGALTLMTLFAIEGFAGFMGMGRLTVDATRTGDFAVIMALALAGSALALALDLVGDFALALGEAWPRTPDRG